MAMVDVDSGSMYRRTHSLSRLVWSWVRGRLAPFYIYQINRVNLLSGFAINNCCTADVYRSCGRLFVYCGHASIGPPSATRGNPQCETDQARSRTTHVHNHARPRIVCMTAWLNVTPMTTEHNRIVRTGKSEAEVTNNITRT